MVSERGDVLQFGSSTPGKSAGVLDRLAKGLACLAIVNPGGGCFLDMRWDAAV